MYAIPGLIALLCVVYIRPQEIAPALARVPLFHVFVLATVVGWVLDLRVGFARLRANPLVPWAWGYCLWSIVTLAAKADTGSNAGREALLSLVSFFLFAAPAQALQSLRGLRIVAAVLLALSLVLAVVGVHQAFAPRGCVSQDAADPKVWRPDGRPCESPIDCALGHGDPTRVSMADPEARTRCEHIGLWGTTSVEGRVRYRGIMEDPNELALVASLALPLAFAPLARRRSAARWLLAAASLIVVGLCTIVTRSRSGQLAFLAALGGPLTRRIGAGAMVLAAPVLLLGGRAGGGAEQSSQERIECWAAAFSLFRASPLLGVGKGQFTEHHPLTAHNSFLLALAEQGLPGLFLWSVVVALALKAVRAILAAPEPLDRDLRPWAIALRSSVWVLMVSSLFLSLTHHHVLWITLGVTASLAEVARARQGSRARLALTWRDAAFVAAADATLVAGIFAYTRLRGA